MNWNMIGYGTVGSHAFIVLAYLFFINGCLSWTLYLFNR